MVTLLIVVAYMMMGGMATSLYERFNGKPLGRSDEFPSWLAGICWPVWAFAACVYYPCAWAKMFGDWVVIRKEPSKSVFKSI